MLKNSTFHPEVLLKQDNVVWGLGATVQVESQNFLDPVLAKPDRDLV